MHYANKRKLVNMEYEAKLHGLEIDKSKLPKDPEKKPDSFMFADPEDYKKLSDEEKKKLTKKMLGRHHAKIDGKIKG